MLKFREDELPHLHSLLGTFYTLADPADLPPLLKRLKDAGYLEERSLLDTFTCYGLTPEGKEVVKRALG